MWNEVNPTTVKIPTPPYKPPCKHKWVHQYTDYIKKGKGMYTYQYQRIETFYCEKCLEIKEIISKDEEGFSSPNWFKE